MSIEYYDEDDEYDEESIMTKSDETWRCIMWLRQLYTHVYKTSNVLCSSNIATK